MTTPDLVFYHAPHSRAGIVAWMLEELGVPYRLEQLSLKQGTHKSPEYLAINPMGKVPAITHGGVVVTEAAAICCYLADAFPAAGLAPATTDLKRGTYFRWMFFSPSCIEPAIADKAFSRPAVPASAVGYGDYDSVMTALSQAVTQGDYVLGDRFSAADVVLGSALRYGLMFKIIEPRPEFIAYVDRMLARPALQRALARDNELAVADA
jgi:glutathione S-transferase